MQNHGVPVLIDRAGFSIMTRSLALRGPCLPDVSINTRSVMGSDSCQLNWFHICNRDKLKPKSCQMSKSHFPFVHDSQADKAVKPNEGIVLTERRKGTGHSVDMNKENKIL
jgi:hypothetical protein